MRRARAKPEYKEGEAERVEFVEVEDQSGEEESEEDVSEIGNGKKEEGDEGKFGDVKIKDKLYVVGTAYTCLEYPNVTKAAAFIEKYAKGRKVLFWLGHSLSAILLAKASMKGIQ